MSAGQHARMKRKYGIEPVDFVPTADWASETLTRLLSGDTFKRGQSGDVDNNEPMMNTKDRELARKMRAWKYSRHAESEPLPPLPSLDQLPQIPRRPPSPKPRDLASTSRSDAASKSGVDRFAQARMACDREALKKRAETLKKLMEKAGAKDRKKLELEMKSQKDTEKHRGFWFTLYFVLGFLLKSKAAREMREFSPQKRTELLNGVLFRMRGALLDEEAIMPTSHGATKEIATIIDKKSMNSPNLNVSTKRRLERRRSMAEEIDHLEFLATYQMAVQDPVLLGQWSVTIAVMIYKHRMRTRRRTIAKVWKMIHNWSKMGRFANAVRKFHFQVRKVQAFWRRCKRRLEEILRRVDDRYSSTEARILKPWERPRTAEQKEERKQFLEGELRARRYRHLAFLENYLSDYADYNREVEEYRNHRAALMLFFNPISEEESDSDDESEFTPTLPNPMLRKGRTSEIFIPGMKSVEDEEEEYDARIMNHSNEAIARTEEQLEFLKALKAIPVPLPPPYVSYIPQYTDERLYEEMVVRYKKFQEALERCTLEEALQRCTLPLHEPNVLAKSAIEPKRGGKKESKSLDDGGIFDFTFEQDDADENLEMEKNDSFPRPPVDTSMSGYGAW